MVVAITMSMANYHQREDGEVMEVIGGALSPGSGHGAAARNCTEHKYLLASQLGRWVVVNGWHG